MQNAKNIKWKKVRKSLVSGEFERLTEEVLQENARIARNHKKIKNIRKYVKRQQENLKFCHCHNVGKVEFVRQYLEIWKKHAKLFRKEGQQFGVAIEKVVIENDKSEIEIAKNENRYKMRIRENFASTLVV